MNLAEQVSKFAEIQGLMQRLIDLLAQEVDDDDDDDDAYLDSEPPCAMDRDAEELYTVGEYLRRSDPERYEQLLDEAQREQAYESVAGTAWARRVLAERDGS